MAIHADTDKIWRVVLQSTLLEQIYLNVLYYAAPGESDGNALELATEFYSGPLIDALISATTNNTIWQSASATGIQNIDDLGFSAENHTGGQEGDALPGFSAYSFALVRDHVGMPQAHKRFSGIPEAFQADGVLDSGEMGFMTSILEALGADVLGIATTYEPVAIQTQLNNVPFAPPGRFWDADLWVYQRITTQVSRRIGRGT